MILRFGKYEGLELDDPRVPTSYIRSLCNPANMEEYIAELARRKISASGKTEMIEEIIARGFSSLTERALHGPVEERDAALAAANAALAALHVMVRKYNNDYGPPATIRKRERSVALELLADKFVSDEDRDWAQRVLAEHE